MTSKVLCVLALGAFFSEAYAAREEIKCSNSRGYKISMDIDYSHQLPSKMKKDASGRSSARVIKFTGRESKETTSAKISVNLPSKDFKDPYYGSFDLKSFYSVNAPAEINKSIDGTATQEFHGNDENLVWEFVINIPTSAVAAESDGFKAELWLQKMNSTQSYSAELDCTSKITKN